MGGEPKATLNDLKEIYILCFSRGFNTRKFLGSVPYKENGIATIHIMNW